MQHWLDRQEGAVGFVQAELSMSGERRLHRHDQLDLAPAHVGRSSANSLAVQDINTQPNIVSNTQTRADSFVRVRRFL
jgi:hypothetical protein